MRDVVIVGGGAGGLAVGLELKQYQHDILLIEREEQLGGILNQCIHNGFGLEVFKEEYTGPEYAHYFIKDFLEADIDYLLDTTVIDIHKVDDYFIVSYSNTESGIVDIKTKAVVLTTGSYERTRGQISIPGDRPYGVLTAGSAQRYINIDGYMVGKKVFILGSGDIGLIMARRLTLEGAEVLGVAEIMPHSNGLIRNIVQCLHDFDIPLYLSHTVTDVIADKHQRLKEIVISKVDDQFKPIKGTEKKFDVDTLLLSIGLIPDVTLLGHLGVDIDEKTKSAKIDQTYQSNIPGVFLCGNALQIHDLVDHVTTESRRAGKAISHYLKRTDKGKQRLYNVYFGDQIHYVTPQKINFDALEKDVFISFRSKKNFEKALLSIYQKDQLIVKKKLSFVIPAEMETYQLNMEDLKYEADVYVYLEERQ